MSERHSEAMRKRWQDPEYRARMSEIRRDPEYRARQSKGVGGREPDPNFRARMSEAMRRRWKDPQYQALMSKVRREQWKDPQFRALISKIRCKLWENIEYRFCVLEGRNRSRVQIMKSYRRAARRRSMGCELAKLLNAPKKSRTMEFYQYLGKMMDEKRLHEIMPPIVAVAIYQKMQAEWFRSASQ